jgi:hypothetical protein
MGAPAQGPRDLGAEAGAGWANREERSPPGYHKGDQYVGGDDRQQPYGRKRKSWLSEIFD